MRRAIHYAVVSIAVIAGLTILVFGILLFHAFITIPSAEPVFELSSYEPGEAGIIDIDISLGYVNVYKSSGSAIEVELVGHKKGLYSASVESGILKITENETSWIDRTLRANSDKLGVGIGIPEGVSVELNVRAAQSAVTIDSVSFVGDSDIDVENGSVSVAGAASDGGISISLENGSVKLETVACPEASAEIANGDIFIRGVNVTKRLSLTAETGQISGYMPQPRSEYRVEASVVTGVCDVKNGGDGKIELIAKVNVGAVTLSFAENRVGG